MKQHCYKYYFGMLSEDKTTIEHLVTYIDTIKGDGSRTVEVPMLSKTFYGKDIMEPFFEAMKEIESSFGEYDDSRKFIMPAWQDDTEHARHNIPFDKVTNYLNIIETKKIEKDIADLVQKNFWELI